MYTKIFFITSLLLITNNLLLSQSCSCGSRYSHLFLKVNNSNQENIDSLKLKIQRKEDGKIDKYYKDDCSKIAISKFNSWYDNLFKKNEYLNFWLNEYQNNCKDSTTKLIEIKDKDIDNIYVISIPWLHGIMNCTSTYQYTFFVSLIINKNKINFFIPHSHIYNDRLFVDSIIDNCDNTITINNITSVNN